MKLLIAIPTNRTWEPDFGNSLIRLIIHTSNKGIATTIHSLQGVSNIARGRQTALDLAFREGFTHLLFIDDDVWFDPKALDYLLSRQKAFVAANFVKKPSLEMIIDGNFKSMPVTKNRNGDLVYSKGRADIEKVDFTGLGFALINIQEIKKIPGPHFSGTDLSEDYAFCRKLSQNNIDIFIDHDATKLVAHVGRYPFSELTSP